MIDISIKENIQRLKNKVFGTDYDESAREPVLLWEKRVEELSRIDDFSRLAVTQEIIKGIKGKLETLAREKLSTKSKDIRQIDALEVKIDENRYFLKLLTPSYQDEIDEIQRMVISELTD